MHTQSISRFKRIVLAIVSSVAFSLTSFAQVDYEFWFAAPYANTDHAPFWPSGYQYKVGGRPIYLRLATQDADADVTITLPAVGSTIASLSIPANSTATVDLTEFIQDIQCSKIGNVVEDKGVYIRSNALITAYYEIASVLNTDIFSLKGQNALGKEFYTPFQNMMQNSSFHNGDGVPDNNVVGDGAYSYIVIVATMDNTTVTVTPTTDCYGITKGQTKSVKLDRGQTYVVRAIGQGADARLSGTYIKSNKPVAVTIGEDSVYPDYFTQNRDCEDYVGDQITPVSVTGRDYIVVQGQAFKTQQERSSSWNASDLGPMESKSKDFYEFVTITATMDNTVLSVDGAQYGSVLNRGESVSIELSDPDKIYTFITATHPVYAFHISGYHCEVAGALLPSVEMCTGSYKMGFVRTYGTYNDQEFYMNLMVKGDGEKDFLLNGESNATINNASFQSIEGTEWKVARIYFSQAAMPEGAYFLQNTTSLFHMGMMNSTSHDWGNGKGYSLMGSMYGYFSRFSDNFPSAKIVNNNDTSITVTRGTKVSLLADGGNKFNWVGYMWNGHDWEMLDKPYYMNLTDVENPYVKIDALGVYKYTATITTDCYDDVDRSVLIKIVEPVDLYNVHDTVCYTPGLSPNDDMSESYNLYNLNDTIVGKNGLVTGYYVDHFEKFMNADTVVWDDFDEQRPMASFIYPGNGSISVVENPDTNGYLKETSVCYLQKTKQDCAESRDADMVSCNDAQRSVWMDIDFSNEPIDLNLGTKFSFDIRYDSTNTGWNYAEHSIYLELVDVKGQVISHEVTTLPTISQNTSYTPEDQEWQHIEVDLVEDFADDISTIGKIKLVRIRGYFSEWANNFGYYIDNIQYYALAHMQLLTVKEAKNYTVTNGDTLSAVVKNYFDITRTDTAKVYLSVKNPGKRKLAVETTDTCASDGAYLREFDLTQYNYNVGGALVANRLWYMDYQRTKPIDNPKYVDVPAATNGVGVTYYVYVDDECDDTPGTLTVTVFAVPEVTDVDITVCEIPDLGGGQGLIDLLEMKNRVTNDLKAKVEWYTDYACTKQIGQETDYPVTDGTKLYAKVFNSERCAAYATVSINVTPVPAITFDGFEICADAEDVTLNAAPSGGVYSGNGVTGGIFSPAKAGVGDHKVTYTIVNDGCTNIDSVVVTVNPQIDVTLENKTGKLNGSNSATLDVKIDPATAKGSYVRTWTEAVTEKNSTSLNWTDAVDLENKDAANPQTKVLTRPTYFALDVVDSKTGCSGSAKVLVDVYIPVEVLLNVTPVCAGSDVTVTADRIGGNGPYTYEWSFSPSSASYQKVNDSTIVLKNPQSDVDVTVKVTDKNGSAGQNVATATKTQVVYANPKITLAGDKVCQGGSLELVPTVTGGTKPYTSAWTGNTDVLSSALDAEKAVVKTKSAAGTYFLTYTVTDKNGCKASENVSAVINQKPVVVAKTAKSVACWADEIDLSSSVTVGSTVNAKYEWTSGSSSLEALSKVNIPNPTFKSNASGTHRFQVVVTDENGCKDTSDEISVRIEPRPSVTVDPLTNLCVSNQGAELSATPSLPAGSGDGRFSYVWSGDVTSTEEPPMLDTKTAGVKKVSVVVTSSNGCSSDAAQGSFTVYENPIAEIANKDEEACALDTVTLKANTSGSNVSYEWSATTPIIGSNTGSSVQVVMPSTTGSANSMKHPVSLLVTDNKTGCKASTTENVTFYRLPEVAINGKTEVCAGGTQVLTPKVAYANSSTYRVNWFLDTLQLSATDVEDPVFTQTGTGVFNIGLKITDAKGCVGKGYIAIKGLELPVANAGEDRVEEWRHDFTLFGSATGGAGDYTYLWSPADSLTSSPALQNPTANLLETNIFTLEVTDGKGCKGTDDVIITIIGQPLKVSIMQNDSLCEGETVTLEALPSGGTGDYRYKWYDMANETVVIGEEKTIDVSITEPTTYKVELSCVGEKSFDPTSETHTVNIYKNPQISIYGGDDIRVCQGLVKSIVPIVTDGTAPYTYEWIEESSPIAVTRESYMFSNSQTTGKQTVTLTITDAVGCTTVKPIEVLVDELPTVSLEDVAVCARADGQAKAVAGTTGTQPFVYSWSGIDDLNIQDNVVTFNIDTKETMTKTLSVTISDNNGCENSADAIVTIKPLPSLELEPRYTVCAEADLLLNINPDGIPGSYNMEWVGGTGKPYVDQTIVTESVFNAPKTGVYTLMYTIEDEAYKCPRTEEIEVEVYPAVKMARIADQIACSSVDLDLSVIAVEGNPSNYTWRGNVSPKDAQNVSFNAAKAGEYEVWVAIGDQYCSDSSSFTVIVKPNPAVSIDGGRLMAVDYMSNVKLNAQIETYTEEPYTHTWTEDSNNIASGANTQSMTTGKIINRQYTYTYTISDKYGCVGSANITLLTEMIVPQLRRLCDGETYEVNPDVLVDTNTVCLTAQADEICEGESTSILPMFISGNEKSISNLSYEWTDATGAVVGTSINLIVTPKETSTYNLHVYNSETGYFFDLPFKVNVHKKPNASIVVSPEWNGRFYTSREGKADYLVIDGNPSSEEYDIEFVSHQWTISPEVQVGNLNVQRTNIYTTKEIKPLTLKYKVVDQYGCWNEVSRDIEIVNQPVPVIVGNNVCEGDTATYYTEVNYPNGSVFWWEADGGTIIGDPTLSHVQVAWDRTENTSITVNVYPKGDRDIEGITRTIYVNPLPDVEIDGKRHVCVGEYAPYEAINHQPSMELVYSWSIVDDYGQITDITYPVSDMATVQWNKVGKDTVVLHAMYGACSVTDSLPVFIHAIPKADFTYQATEDVYFRNEGVTRHTDSIFVDKEVTFTNLTKNADNYEFYWDFIGDGVYTENTKDAVYEYDEVGDFTVSLMVVENMWGCNNVIAKPLKVVPNPNCGMTFPNAFTPDLTENNTFYPVYKEGVLENGYELRIYNRWGTLLWSTTDLYAEWDGVYKGSVSKQDVYVYQCKATCEDIDPATGEHRVLNLKGDVTIVR